MYCSKCGSLIDDQVQFCPFCGNQVSISGVTPKSQHAGLNPRQEEQGRFALFKNLIPPLQKMEGIQLQINEKGQRLFSIKGFSFYVMRSTASAVIGFIAGIMSVFGFANNAIIGNFIGLPLLLGLSEDSYAYYPVVFFWGLIICPLIFCVVYHLLFSFFVALLRFVFTRSEVKTLENTIPKLQGEKDKIFESIKDDIRYVPQSYRYSEALAAFVTAYENSEADTLKEAINIYRQNKQNSQLTQMIDDRLARIEELASRPPVNITEVHNYYGW